MRTILRHESASKESVLKLWFLLLILESGRFMMANMPMPLRDSIRLKLCVRCQLSRETLAVVNFVNFIVN